MTNELEIIKRALGMGIGTHGEPCSAGETCQAIAEFREALAAVERLEAERQSDTFLIYFADPDMRPEVYYGGGAERAARHRLEALNLNWDVTLFAAIKSTKESANEQPR